jgi:hypothetical protein
MSTGSQRKYVAVSPRADGPKFDADDRRIHAVLPERLHGASQSTGADEDYGWLGAVPQMREWTGDRIFNDLRELATYVVENRDYESSVRIPKNAIDDDRYGLYGDVVANMADEGAQAPRRAPRDRHRKRRQRSPSPTGSTSTTPTTPGATRARSRTTSPTDVATTTAPTATEFKAAFEAAVVQMLGFKNDKRQKVLPRDRRTGSPVFAVGVPTNMRGAAYAAFESVIISNSTNVVIDQARIIYCLPELTTTTKFHVWFNLGARSSPSSSRTAGRSSARSRAHETRAATRTSFSCATGATGSGTLVLALRRPHHAHLSRGSVFFGRASTSTPGPSPCHRGSEADPCSSNSERTGRRSASSEACSRPTPTPPARSSSTRCNFSPGVPVELETTRRWSSPSERDLGPAGRSSNWRSPRQAVRPRRRDRRRRDRGARRRQPATPRRPRARPSRRRASNRGRDLVGA